MALELKCSHFRHQNKTSILFVSYETVLSVLFLTSRTFPANNNALATVDETAAPATNSSTNTSWMVENGPAKIYDTRSIDATHLLAAVTSPSPTTD